MVRRLKKRVENIKANKLNAAKFGLAGGIISAIFVLVISIAGRYGLFFHWLILIENIYGFLGYSISLIGMTLGMIYAFIDGFVMTWLFAWIYNKLL